MGALVSCGAKKATEDTSVTYTESSQGTPNEYRFVEQRCEELDSRYLPQSPEIKMFIDGKYEFLKMEKIKNEHIVRALLLGGEIEQGRLRGGRLQILKDPKSFKYCFQPEDLKDDHFEDAALSILDPLNKFENRYKDLIKNNRIDKVTVRVLPKYHQLGSKRRSRGRVVEKRELINNAFYSSARKEIVFLPQGANKVGYIPFGGVELWKQPMVALHEYGHHFFRTLTGVTKRSSVHDSLCFDNRDALATHSENKNHVAGNTIRKVDMNLAFNALNEGFADIFSFYGNVDNTNLDSFGCMSMSRDVTSFFYISRLRKSEILPEYTKVLTQDALDEFMQKQKNESQACTIKTSFQDIHNIGAIYAHAFYKLLNSTKVSKKKKLSLLIEWVKLMKPIYESKPSIISLFEQASHQFYKLFIKHFPRKKHLCNYYYSSFPTIPNRC